MGSMIASAATGSSALSVPVPAFPGVCLLRVTLAEGRPRTVLSVEGELVDHAGESASRPAMYATVNGLGMRREPADGGPSPGSSVKFSLDLDAAEARSPGTFHGRRLEIALFGFDDTGAGFISGAVSLVGRLERRTVLGRRGLARIVPRRRGREHSQPSGADGA